MRMVLLLTNAGFLDKLNGLFPSTHLTGHGFRAGGTTELIMRGVPTHIVQVVGR